MGSLMEGQIEEGDAMTLLKAYRHNAIGSFVRTFSTKAFLAIYGVDLCLVFVVPRSGNWPLKPARRDLWILFFLVDPNLGSR